MNRVELVLGDCLEELDKISDNSIDAIVTDPPYGLTSITKRFGKKGSAPAKYGNDGSFARLSKGFMGKEWDGSGIEYNVELWEKCLRVLKPGGYLLAFGGTRTFHRIACAIEDSGFEIRDTIMWVYGSGFPKSMNIGLAIDKKLGKESRVIGEGKSGVSSRAYQSEATTTAGAYQVKEAQNEWKGWGTALKPAYEPIIVARKPFKGSLVDNVMENRVGGINIDECRVGDEVVSIHNAPTGSFAGGEPGRGSDTNSYRDGVGRFPANLVLTYDETDKDEVCGGFPESKGGSGNAARYFYCAKASRKDRDEGLEEFSIKTKVFNGKSDSSSKDIKDVEERFTTQLRNIHPTVKPTSLMQYLIRLVAPKGATILDPFMGSGSTGKAVMYENKERGAEYSFIGIEKEKEYLEIAKARPKYVHLLQ